MASEISADKDPICADPICAFKSWALQMGCPVSALPSDAALDRLIKANPAGVKKLMEQCRPKSEVKTIRDNLMLSGLLSGSNTLLDRQQTVMPNKLENLKQKEKINRQIDELKPRVERLRNEFKATKSSLFAKAEQLKETRRTHRSTKSKSIQLEQKHAQLKEKIAVEKRYEAILADGMPIPIDAPIDSKAEAEKAVTKSLQYLKSVYNGIGDGELTKADRDKVEREIMKTMEGIPVVAVYEAIKYHRELNVARLNANRQQPSSDQSIGQTALDVAITKSRIRMYVDHHLANKKLKDEYSARVEEYVQLYDQYVDQMLSEMKLFNGSDVELFADSICRDYLKQYATWISSRAMLQFKQQKLAAFQQRAKERDSELKGNDVVAAELTAKYQLIEKTYNSAYEDVVSLGDTNRGLKQLQALSIYTINSFGQRNKRNTSTSLLNSVFGSALSSMKLNWAPGGYKNEVSLLVNLMYEQRNQLPASMDLQCHRPIGTVSPFYGLLTPTEVLEQFKKRWDWHKAIEALTQSLDVNETVPQVTDAELISANFNAEYTKMAKSMDEIRFMYETGNQTVAQIRKYLQFLLDTSLGSLIPEGVLINRRSFRDYEEEFLCACSLIANSMKRN